MEAIRGKVRRGLYLTNEQAIEAVAQASHDLDELLAQRDGRRRDGLAKWDLTPSQTEQLFDLMLAVPIGRAAASSYVDRALGVRRWAYEVATGEAERVKAEAIAAILAAIDALNAIWEILRREAEERLGEPLDRLNAASGKLAIEMRRAGRCGLRLRMESETPRSNELHLDP